MDQLYLNQMVTCKNADFWTQHKTFSLVMEPVNLHFSKRAAAPGDLIQAKIWELLF